MDTRHKAFFIHRCKCLIVIRKSTQINANGDKGPDLRCWRSLAEKTVFICVYPCASVDNKKWLFSASTWLRGGGVYKPLFLFTGKRRLSKTRTREGDCPQINANGDKGVSFVLLAFIGGKPLCPAEVVSRWRLLCKVNRQVFFRL